MLRRVARRLARVLVGLIVIILILVGLALSIIETGWAKNRIRDLIVRQANGYLTATLTIGRLEGSLLRGLRLGEIDLSRDGRSLVHIDEIALSYSIKELFESGTTIRRIRLTRPRFALARQADGRWDIAAIVKRESREGPRTGPRRPIVIQEIEIVDGRVMLADPLAFGAARVPTRFDALNATLAFAYFPVRWRLDFTRMAWVGRDPDLTMKQMTGALGVGPRGWFFDKLAIETPQSAYTVNGGVIRGDAPTALDLTVHAERFAFQEWSGILRGLRNIAIEASFDTKLEGPLSRLATEITLAGTGGSVEGQLTLDTTVPGWHGAGAVNVSRLNLARWLNNPQRPSDVTGRVTFDLALELGKRFPRGVYTFDGPHAMYMSYAADRVKASGQITSEAVLVRQATAIAYGSRVALADGSIGIDSPFPYRFQGRVTEVDLRNVPETVPVPRVESLLTFDYDVTGQFSQPFISGTAIFARSTYLGATIGDGLIGTIDSSARPIHYTGDGEISGVNLHRFGEGLQVGWLQDPRYAGTISGRFRVDASGADRATLWLTANGWLSRGELFHGTLSDAAVTLAIDRGTLSASYSGRMEGVDPAVPFDDPRWQASLTGSGTFVATIPGLLVQDIIALDDYDVEGSLALQSSSVHEIPFDRARLRATLRRSMLTVTALEASGPTIEGRGSGTIALDDEQPSAFDYDVTRADLERLQPFIGAQATGTVATKGHLSGPWSALHAAGDGSIAPLDAFNVQALTVNGKYDLTVPSGDAARIAGRVEGRGSFVTLLGQSIKEMTGTFALDAQRLNVDLRVERPDGITATINSIVRLRLDERAVDLSNLTINLGRAPWRLAPATSPATVRWDDDGVSVTPMTLVGGNGDQEIRVAGDWRSRGGGALHVVAAHVFLDSLQAAFDRPTRYGGVLDLDVTVRGTADRPTVDGTLTVTSGRVERVSYQKLVSQVQYANGMATIDARLDQAPGVWITAVGKLPLGLFDRSRPDQPVDVAIKSSGIELGLVEGLTNVVRHVSGRLLVDVRAVGTSGDPHFTGAIGIEGAAFDVVSSGAKYKNGRVGLTLTPDRVAVDVFHLEDSSGRALEVRGSLGTHELRVGDVAIEISSRRFEVLRNEFGRLDVDARLQLQGRFESPRLTGELTISSGDLRVDEVLSRTIFKPYATEPGAITEVVDPIAALNPWDRLGINLILHVPNTLRLVGDNVQITPGTPVGLGDINLRVAGDLSLYKDPGQPLYVTGSFDSLSGTYAFQGRRFEIDPASSIEFRGDLSPELYVAVTRVISGVQTRVALIGPLQQPELRLSSVPPLGESDILSLIVFNSSANDLNALQQQELVARAGALAAGFLATPLVSALSSQIGLDILEIEPTDEPGVVGAKVTIGQEIAPGLVARFSRQFGPEPYDEATIEYYLSRILRLRATFSDAQTLVSRSPFRRVERAGIDLLIFFSF